MSKVAVWKYSLPTRGHATVELPDGADIVSIQNQDETVTMWALVDPKKPTRPRDFYVAMTGESIVMVKAALRFLDTVQLDGGRYVAHVFEIMR